MLYLEVYQTKKSKRWKWRFYNSKNKHIIAVSYYTYKTRNGALRAFVKTRHQLGGYCFYDVIYADGRKCHCEPMSKLLG